MDNMKIYQDIVVRTIKIIDIAYVAVLYFFLGIFGATYLDRLFYLMFGHTKKKNNYIVMLEILTQIIITGIITYFGRNIVPLIPFPLNGIYGFDHHLVKEVNSGSVFGSVLIMFQKTLSEKVNYLREQKNPLNPIRDTNY
jgi:hypothetical protein